MTIDSTQLAENPVRDARFEVKDVWHEMATLPHDHPDAHVEFLHRQMNEEVEGLEIASRNLIDFPNEAWELRMAIARQCADEARHAIAFRRLLEARGSFVGCYPVLNFQFRIITSISSLIGRLAVANRSFEAAGIDAIQDGIDSSRRQDDVEFMALFDAQLADEVQHVRFANVWVKKIIERDGARAIMDLAHAVAYANEAVRHIAGDGMVVYPIADDVRREAGFTEDEILSARTQVEEMR
jgi:uncharacterized ferritin-like protein (DUF455 family)